MCSVRELACFLGLLHTCMLLIQVDGEYIKGRDLAVIVLSQPTEYHRERAQYFVDHIRHQAAQTESQPTVELMHKAWPSPGSWAILPVLREINRRFITKKAVMFCEEESRVHLKPLLKYLSSFNLNRPLFLGKGLRDKKATIIHYYKTDPYEFQYPDFAACCVLSTSLLKLLAKELDNRLPYRPEFAMDPKYILAQYIWNKGKGHLLTDAKDFCAGNERDGCITLYPPKYPDCGQPTPSDEVYIGVKTSSEFHNNRVIFIQTTWGKDNEDIGFYSDEADPNVPAYPTGVEDNGYCAKLEVILEHMMTDQNMKDRNWFVIVDDETVLGTAQLYRLLSCYDPSETFVLGERYGYRLHQDVSYDYVSTAGGLVFTRPALTKLMLLSKGDLCEGRKDTSADMQLGKLLRRFNIPVVHSPLFHQANPDDYADLSHKRPVSFHRHGGIHATDVYQKWFSKPLSKHAEEKQSIVYEHEEL